MEVFIDGRRYVPEPVKPEKWKSPGAVLRRGRESMGLSLDSAAGLAGISKTYLWELETNKAKDPSLRVGAALAALYSIDLMLLARSYK